MWQPLRSQSQSRETSSVYLRATRPCVTNLISRKLAPSSTKCLSTRLLMLILRSTRCTARTSFSMWHLTNPPIECRSRDSFSLSSLTGGSVHTIEAWHQWSPGDTMFQFLYRFEKCEHPMIKKSSLIHTLKSRLFSCRYWRRSIQQSTTCFTHTLSSQICLPICARSLKM